jgi:hypothetical protein
MTHGIDHLVLACHDLTEAAECYRRLGFQVGARNRHPWGTENHIVQLRGSFLELIGLGPDFQAPQPDSATAPFAGFLADYLGRRQGFAMLVLESGDAAADHAAFTAKNIAAAAAKTPFHFERRARRPDGRDVVVGFTLAFARSPLIPRAGFFVCQQHCPENFWNPAFQSHPNGARAIRGVVLVADDPTAHLDFLRGFAQRDPQMRKSESVRLKTARGSIDILTPDRFRIEYGAESGLSDPGFAAYRVEVETLDTLVSLLDSTGMTFARHADRLVVPPNLALGCYVAFESH